MQVLGGNWHYMHTAADAEKSGTGWASVQGGPTRIPPCSRLDEQKPYNSGRHQQKGFTIQVLCIFSMRSRVCVRRSSTQCNVQRHT
jgi:hypothetical protein